MINEKLTRDEQSRHNQEIEKVVKGKGYDDTINEAIKLLQGNGFSVYL